MKISDFKNEEAIDLLADIMEPTARLLSNSKLKEAIKANKTKGEIIKLILKEGKAEIMEILAYLHREDPQKFKCTVVSITKDLFDILNDEDLKDFFTSQAQMMAKESSTSAMANTEEQKN